MAADTTYDIKLFGHTEVRSPGATLTARDFGGIKPRQILTLLALRGALSKAELADQLWQGSPPADHTATLESYVSVLRRRLGGSSTRTSIVVTRNGGYAIDGDRATTDVGRFDALVAAAQHQPPPLALTTLSQALSLAEEPLLADEPHVTWATEFRGRYLARLVEAATRAAEHALTVRQPAHAQELASRATAIDPLAEHAWRLRMTAYQQVGDRAGALRSYDTCRRALADDLGVAPTPATSDLFVAILSENAGVPGFDDVVLAVLAAARELAAAPDEPDQDGSQTGVVQLLTRAQALARAVPGLPGQAVPIVRVA
jgi:DNA-binding SARP family transcriptional activator